MQKVNSVYIIMLIAAIVLYVVDMTFMASELQSRVGKLEHAMAHIRGSGISH
jgi:hypothetical protein